MDRSENLFCAPFETFADDTYRRVANCSENLFCASLPQETRAKLCEHCHRTLMKAGSVQLYSSFTRNVTIILDGIICCSTTVNEDDIEASATPPLFALCLPGRPLSLDTTFFGQRQMDALSYMYNSMTCLTDCFIASFSPKVFRHLFNTDEVFRQTLMQAALMMMGDFNQFSALMRADSMYTKVNLLMKKLLECNIYLSQTDIAKLLSCNRTSVSRAFERTKTERPDFFAAYSANKHRPVAFYRGDVV